MLQYSPQCVRFQTSFSDTVLAVPLRFLFFFSIRCFGKSWVCFLILLTLLYKITLKCCRGRASGFIQTLTCVFTVQHIRTSSSALQSYTKLHGQASGGASETVRLLFYCLSWLDRWKRSVGSTAPPPWLSSLVLDIITTIKLLAAQVATGQRKSNGMQFRPPGYCLLCILHSNV